MFHVTIISDLRLSPLREVLQRRGCSVDEVHYTSFIPHVELSLYTTADIVICFPSPNSSARSGYLTYARALSLETQLRGLSDGVCTVDGRKWRSIPFLLMWDEADLRGSFFDRAGSFENVVSYFGEYEAFIRIKNAVDMYRRKLVDGFDNLGFLVKHEKGRLRIGPALGGLTGLENDFYNGRADQTRTSQSGLVTIDREMYGIQYEVEQLEFLVNKKGTKEAEFQKFFEENPHFLSSHRRGIPLPHPKFPINTRKSLIPDFVVKPHGDPRRDSNWEVLDLKLPGTKLLAGKGNRAAFSHGVAKAVSQLRDYEEYFKNPLNKDAIERVLKHHLKFPKLAVLIGRTPRDGEVEALELAQSRNPAVKIITYDEILEAQKDLMD